MMKSHLRNKYLLHLLNTAQANKGFTLIELLIVIVIIGALAAIALPSFLQQANRARATEGITSVAAINRYQFVFYQRQARFADTLDDLDIKVNAQFYKYSVSNPEESYAGVETETRWTSLKAISGAIKTENGAMKSLVCVSDAIVDQGDASLVPASTSLAALACPVTYSPL
jgi:prepilin-type N-terminal cleavage/methylation domain-containing protein